MPPGGEMRIEWAVLSHRGAAIEQAMNGEADAKRITACGGRWMVRRRSRPRRGPTRHVYVDDPEWEGYCLGCHLPEANAVHVLPERDQQEKQHEQQRMGERG